MDRESIRQKLARGDLPRADFARTRIRPGGLGACAICGQVTTPLDPVVVGENGEQRLTLHPDCYVMWDEERNA